MADGGGWVASVDEIHWERMDGLLEKLKGPFEATFDGALGIAGNPRRTPGMGKSEGKGSLAVRKERIILFLDRVEQILDKKISLRDDAKLTIIRCITTICLLRHWLSSHPKTNRRIIEMIVRLGEPQISRILVPGL
ncbi:hypothetical protein AAMO2058_001706800 [Amorphochlora amoebiformis]